MRHHPFVSSVQCSARAALDGYITPVQYMTNQQNASQQSLRSRASSTWCESLFPHPKSCANIVILYLSKAKCA